MKKSNLVELFSVLFLFSVLSFTTSALARFIPPDDPPPPPDTQKYAVIIGVSNYSCTNMGDLHYADDDATDWYDHLTENLNWESSKIRVLGDDVNPYSGIATFKLATEKNVISDLEWLVSSADDDDVIAIIFSGHGYFSEDYDNQEHSAVCLWDYADVDPEDYPNDGLLNDTELADILNGAAAKRIFVFIDSCYSGHFCDELGDMTYIANLFCVTAVPLHNRSLEPKIEILRCMAVENHTLQNGVWTYYFLHDSWITRYGATSSIGLEVIFNYAKSNYYKDCYEKMAQIFDGHPYISFLLN